MRGRIQKYRSGSYAWDTETASYDVTLYTSGGVMASVYVSIMYDDKPSEDIVKTFKSLDAAGKYINELRGEAIA